MLTSDMNELRLQEALLNASRALLKIGREVQGEDFLTRRLHNIAVNELARTFCANIRLEDLDRAFVVATVGPLSEGTMSQHTCRYLAEVMRTARSIGRDRRTTERTRPARGVAASLPA